MLNTKIPPDFLSKNDEEYLSTLIADYFWEKNIPVESFSYHIEVDYLKEA
jgi:hypothetical protein